MMPSQSINVFVSYSYADASLVAPVVKLLRVNKSFVFQDIDDIQPGKRWRNEIARALAESHLVVVFWCEHASRSDEVSKEWKAAIEQAKDLLPLLLDATPLPPELVEFQWIDFRGTVGASHSSIVLSDHYNVWELGRPSGRKQSRLRPVSLLKSARWSYDAGFAAAFAAAVAVAVAMLKWDSLPNDAPFIILIGVVFIITACLAWLLRRRSRGERPYKRVARLFVRLKDKAQQVWGDLTDDELDIIPGKREELIGRLQKKYGYTRERAEQESDRFLDTMLADELEAETMQRRMADELEAEIIRRIGHLEVTEQPDTLTASGTVGAPPTEK